MTAPYIAGCGIQPIGAAPQVSSQFALLNSYTGQTFDAAVSLANQIINYPVPNVSFEILLNNPQDFALKDSGDPPVVPGIALPNLPGFPGDPGYVDIAPPMPAVALPPSPGNSPTPVIPVPPTLYTPSFGPDPTLVFPTVPTYFDLTGGIPFPILFPITLPTPPVIDVDDIMFQGVPPIFTAQAPDPRDFQYTDPGYQPLLVNQIKATILSMMNGQSGLPTYVENAIWARDVERESGEFQRAEAEAISDWAMRGFTIPGGPLDSKMIQINQGAQNKRVSQSRDVMIQVHNVLIEQLKQALIQGIALEDLWVKVYTSIQDRALQAARFAIDIAIAVYNANIEKYKADADVFRAFADVYKTQIEAQMVKAQVYSEEIRAQQLIGELNEQEVRIYTARLQAIETNVRIYLANIQAYTAQLDGQRLILDLFKTEIEVEKTKLEANELQVREFEGLLQAQNTIQEAWKTRAEIYGTMVDAYVKSYEADIERFKGDIEEMQAVTQRFEALISAYTALANYTKAKADIQLDSNKLQLELFTAAVEGDKAYNEALTTKMKALADATRDTKDIALKNADINAHNMLQTVQLVQGALEAASHVLTQLSAGAMSAVHVQASINDGTNSSYSCSTLLSESFNIDTSS